MDTKHYNTPIYYSEPLQSVNNSTNHVQEIIYNNTKRTFNYRKFFKQRSLQNEERERKAIRDNFTEEKQITFLEFLTSRM